MISNFKRTVVDRAIDEVNLFEDVAPKPKRKAASRSGGSGADPLLAHYIRDLADHEPMTPEEEQALARKIEDAENEVWAMVLSHAPAVPHLAEAIGAFSAKKLPALAAWKRAATVARTQRSSRTSASALARASSKLAAELRRTDLDRELQGRVFGELDRAAAGEELGGYRPTTRAFTQHLTEVRSAQRGADSARQEFVRRNLRLVMAIARRFRNMGLPFPDLIQEGNLGLLKAVDRFDPHRGFRFSTYASWWIRHAIQRALADKGRLVRLPVHQLEARTRIRKAARRMSAQSGDIATPEELAKETGLAVRKVNRALAAPAERPVSLDRPIGGDDEDRSWHDIFMVDEGESPVEQMVLRDDVALMQDAFRTLKPVEADILKQRFGLENDVEETLADIGKRYGLSRERIRQIQNEALDKLRRAMARAEAPARMEQVAA